MSDKANISKIELSTSDGRKIELSLEDAKELHAALASMFAEKKTEVIHRHEYDWWPNRYWYYGQWHSEPYKITWVDSSSGTFIGSTSGQSTCFSLKIA